MQPIKEIRDRMIKELCEIYPEKESAILVTMLFHAIAGIDNTEFSLHPGKMIDHGTVDLLTSKFRELMLHKPIQYVTGAAFFYDMELDVDSAVLIPRPETEELVQWIHADFRNLPGLNVLDIGTGSGNIILALGRLMENPGLTAIDTSRSALKTASGNADKFGLQVQFLRRDILMETDWDFPGKFDLIVSNPPYVRDLEKISMCPNVLDYEPHSALFVPDDDPLKFYRAIAGFASKSLKPDGKIYLEINENFGTETIDIFRKSGFSDLVLKQDIRGKDRMIRAGF